MLMVDRSGRQLCPSAARLSLVGARVVPMPVSERGVKVSGLMGRLLQALQALMDGSALKVRVQPRQKELRVIETLSLGPRKQVILMSCKGERFLVGTGSDSVDTIVRLRALPDEDEAGLRGRAQDHLRGDRP